MTKQTKEILSRVFWGTVKTILLSFAVYFASTVFLALIFYEDVPAGSRDFTPIHISLVVIFGVSYYFGYLRKYSEERKISNHDKFIWKEELFDFLKVDGKYLLIFYGILAAVNEAGWMIDSVNIVTSLYPCFSLSHVISIPVFRTLVSYVISITVIFSATMIKHYSDYLFWKNKNNEKPTISF